MKQTQNKLRFFLVTRPQGDRQIRSTEKLVDNLYCHAFPLRGQTNHIRPLWGTDDLCCRVTIFK